MHFSEFAIGTDQKPPRILKESTIGNKKNQYWTTTIRGNNCTIKYIEGKKKNACADLFAFLHIASQS